MTFPLTRSRSRARFFGTPFSPVSLFANGEQGVLFDVSDLTTLFQDAAGTTPTTMETRVRLMLDKSGRGNHATAPSDASSPILRARYNLLEHSEDFSNAYWNKTSAPVTISTNATVAPDGTTTADKVIATAANSAHRVFNVAGLQAINNTNYTFSFYVKAAEQTWAYVDAFFGTNAFTWFDLTNGTVGTNAAGNTASITSVGNGWYFCKVVRNSAGSGTSQLYIGIGGTPADNTVTFAGNGTDGIFIWGADLRTSADAALNIPAYQSITTATSYDTNGFPPYLAFDGTDDSFSTASIDFTGTPQMTVFAGVTKLSDAAQGVVVELSATIASNNGTFLLAAPDGATQTFGWDSKGTLQVDAVATSQAAPRNAVLTGIGDIGVDICTIRVNGAQADTDTGDQGTGNYGNYPLFIGRRNNTSDPLNGRIYSLIIRGAATTTPLIASTEQWVAGKMRLPI